jgi:hypothetical protein
MFADEAIAKKFELSKRHFERAMTRLFAANRIKMQSFGPKSKIRTRIVDTARTDLFRGNNVVQFPTDERD